MKDLHSLSNSWQTPDWLFDQLNEEFHFDIDLCATKANSKCDDHCLDYLNDIAYCISEEFQYSFKLATTDWLQTCFMNPPYSNPRPFIEKAWEDSKHCEIVCLVKCDPSTRWWATFWEYDKECYNCGGRGAVSPCPQESNCVDFCPVCKGNKIYNGPKAGCEVRFFPKRIKFDPPQELIDIGEVWKVRSKWVKQCGNCQGKGDYILNKDINERKYTMCDRCKGKGYKELSGPTLSSALLIFDRRGL